MKMIWRYEDGMKIWRCSTCPSSAQVRTCRVQSACCSPSPSVSAGWLKAEEGWILQHSGSLGLYLYTAAGDIQYCDTIPFFHVPNTLISLIICHHDNKIRDNGFNFLWGLLKPEHMEIISRFSTIANWIERFAMVFTFADIWFAIFE